MEQNIKLVADVTIISNDKTVLVKYKNCDNYNGQQGWFIPDDLINTGEHPDDAAIRILKEQLGIETESIKIDHIESFTGMDKSWHVIFHYVYTGENAEANAGENVAELNWFDVNALPDDKEISHHGWAKWTLQTILSNRK